MREQFSQNFHFFFTDINERETQNNGSNPAWKRIITQRYVSKTIHFQISFANVCFILSFGRDKA